MKRKKPKTKPVDAESNSRLVRCIIKVGPDGRVRATYRWSHLQIDGHDCHDEDVTSWSDQEIKQCVADLIGVTKPEDLDRMVVERD